MPQICRPSTGVENCQLHRHPQTRKEVILGPKILPPDFTPVMLWETPGINCGKTAVPNCPDVQSDPPLTDGSPT